MVAWGGGSGCKWSQPGWLGGRPDGSRAPLLRREFSLNGGILVAELRISGLGYYEAWLNGRRVGDQVLDPAQTDYELRVFYVSHDVTGLIQEGATALGVMLGNGWYNPLADLPADFDTQLETMGYK